MPRHRDTLASKCRRVQCLARMVSDLLFLAKTERSVDLLTRNADVADGNRALGDLLKP